jgi:ribonuclease Z
MTRGELFILGTSSQVPTRDRNHNGYFLRFLELGFLFDPGEGTQRQMLLAGVPASSITHILISHFHGDHVLGLPGIVQRISLDQVPHTVQIIYPRSGEAFLDRLLNASSFANRARLSFHPVSRPGVVVDEPDFHIEAVALEHAIEDYGYRIQEKDRRRFDKEKLEELTLAGPIVGELSRTGKVVHRGRTIRIEEVSDWTRGRSFAFVMDTLLSRGCETLFEDADLVLSEATFLDRDRDLARAYKHLTAAQSSDLAREMGTQRLVLTHFSQRYLDTAPILAEAREIFPAVRIARDLVKIDW